MTPLARMIVIIVAIFIVMKIAVLAVSPARLRPVHAFAFFLWPGMRPSTFAVRRDRRIDLRSLGRGLMNVAIGVALFLLARFVAASSVIAGVVLALVAFSLALHFGLFSIVTAFWRFAGFKAEDLFIQPWRSRSLAEFWSRRWNVGFSDMIALVIHRPIAARYGRTAGIIASFLGSAVLHELAISVPAAGGYGLPSLYFALHGALVAMNARGRAVTLVALLAPVPLVFHPPFVRAIVIPLLLR